MAAPLLFGLLTAAVALVAGGAALADEATVAGILHDEHTFLAAGGDILSASAQDGQVDAAACTAVQRLPGVDVAAAVDQRRARIVGRPDTAQTVLVATPGIERIVGASPLMPGEVLVGAPVAARWSWSPGVRLALAPDPTYEQRWTPPAGALRVAAVPALDRLGDVASTAIVVVTPLAAADECLVQVTPSQIDGVARALPALLGERPGRTIDVRHQVERGRFGPDAAQDFAARPTRWTGWAAGGVVGLLLAFVLWSRRQRSALYATLGVRWSHGVAIRFTESTFPILAGAAWGGVWAALAGLLLGLAPSTTLAIAWRQVVVAAAVAFVVALPAALWRPPVLAALKDR